MNNFTVITATPAYGRDYKSKADVLKHWNEGFDFLYDGKPFNKPYAESQGWEVRIRYARLRKIVCIEKST